LAGIKGDENIMYQNRAYKPKRVQQAVFLLYINIGIAVLRCIIEFPDFSSKPRYIGPFISLMVVVFATWLFLIYMTGNGKNWARIILLIMLTLGILSMIRLIWQSFTANPVSGLLNVSTTIIDIIALIFLLQKQSSNWFRQMKANKHYRYNFYKPS
jgi:hypothetical protein